jgi:hypothetical protein
MLATETQSSAQQKRPKRSFDSLAFAKRLQTGGVFSRDQAEMLAEEQAALIDDRLATKDDIEGLKADIEALRIAAKVDSEALQLSTKADSEALRLGTEKDIAMLRADIERSKAELIKWFVGISFTQLATLIAVIKFHL